MAVCCCGVLLKKLLRPTILLHHHNTAQLWNLSGHRARAPVLRRSIVDSRFKSLSCPGDQAATGNSKAAPLQNSSRHAPRSEAVRAAQVRHGAVLGLAEVVQALADLGHRPAAGVQADLAELPQRIVGAKLLRGKGGDIMRAAYCR